MTRKNRQIILGKAFKRALEDLQTNLDFLKENSVDEPNIGQAFYQLGMYQAFAKEAQETIDDLKKKVKL